MTLQEGKEILMQSNTDDFNTMRGMLSVIETKIIQLHPHHQKEFYKSLQNIIMMAWEDACDPDNEYLYKNPFDFSSLLNINKHV